MSYIGGKPAEHYDVRSDNFILTHVFCPVKIHVFVGDVIERVDPTFIIQGNEVDKLIGCDKHGVRGHGHPVGPNCHLKNRRRLWWFGVWIACHETPKARRRFEGTCSMDFWNDLGDQCPVIIHRTRFTVACVTYEEDIDIGINRANAKGEPHLPSNRRGQSGVGSPDVEHLRCLIVGSVGQVVAEETQSG